MYMFDIAGQGQWQECTSLPAPPVDEDTSRITCGFEEGDVSFMRCGCKGWFRSAWLKLDRASLLWKSVEPGPEVLALDKVPPKGFSTGGKYYQLQAHGDYHGIHHFDLDTKIATHQHSISRKIEPGVGEIAYTITVEPLFILPVNNELLAIAHWEDVLGSGYCLIESTGFGSQSKDIVWQKVRYNSNYCVHGASTFAMCPIEL
ncbi:unnamed protein product [Calypogeia fissa]